MSSSNFSGRFSALISQMAKVSVQVRPPLSHLFALFIAATKIKWQNGGDEPYFVHYRGSFAFSLFSPSSFFTFPLTFYFLGIGFYPLRFSNAGRIGRNLLVESAIGARPGDFRLAREYKA